MLSLLLGWVRGGGAQRAARRRSVKAAGLPSTALSSNIKFSELSPPSSQNPQPNGRQGQPDVASRLFLKKLKQTLAIPVLALVDSDPYGLKILSVYMKGAAAVQGRVLEGLGGFGWARGGARCVRLRSPPFSRSLPPLSPPLTNSLAHLTNEPFHTLPYTRTTQGSMNMSYDSSNLTTPDIKWLGVRPSDLDR